MPNNYLITFPITDQLSPRYHMFLSSLSKTCSQLGLAEEASDYSTALEAVLQSAAHTNTMMWIGSMVDCPIDLSGQGQLLR